MQTNKPPATADESEPALGLKTKTRPKRSRPGRILVETEALLLVGLFLFVAAAIAAEKLAGLDEPLSLGPWGAIAFAAVPAVLWLGYFYRQDRHEPEPKLFVAGMFLLGAFVAGPTASFFLDQALQRSVLAPIELDPLSPELLVRMLLVIAVVQELTKYVAIRYSIYPSREFDEPLDGIIYASAVGIGFATYENVQFLRGGGEEVLLSAGASTVVVTTLAHACFAGVMGYALARAKFSSRSHARRSITLAAGLLAAALLNGIFQVVTAAAAGRGQVAEPWREVALTTGFVIVVFFGVSLLARRLATKRPEAKP